MSVSRHSVAVAHLNSGVVVVSAVVLRVVLRGVGAVVVRVVVGVLGRVNDAVLVEVGVGNVRLGWLLVLWVVGVLFVLLDLLLEKVVSTLLLPFVRLT